MCAGSAARSRGRRSADGARCAEALQKARALAQFLEPLGADLRRVEPGALGQKREVLRS